LLSILNTLICLKKWPKLLLILKSIAFSHRTYRKGLSKNDQSEAKRWCLDNASLNKVYNEMVTLIYLNGSQIYQSYSCTNST
jgi:hypothetical protein